MVRYTKSKRYAFTLVELIFAIIVIAITIMSLPMMTQVTSKGLESNILQEAIFAASAELMGASSGYWDRNSMVDNNSSTISRVIDINGTCDNNTSSARYRLKNGHIAQKYHRRCVDSSSVTPADTSDSTYPNLNNAAHGAQDIFTDTTTDARGYKETYKSSVNVTRAGNIKLVVVDINKSSGELIARLKMKSANIGEIDYLRRKF